MRLIIFLILISCNYSFAAEDFIAYWECVKSDSIKLIPARDEIKIPIDLKKNSINSTKLLSLIDLVMAEKDYDYTTCLSLFSSNLKGAMEELKDLTPELKNQIKQLTDTVYAKTTFYAQENYQKRAPVFLPMDSVSYKLNSSEKKIILKSIQNNCELPVEIPQEIFLSRNFLQDILKPNLLEIKNKSRACYLKLKDNLLKAVNPYFQTPNECRKSKLCKSYQSAVAKYTQEIGFIFNDVHLVEKKIVTAICSNNYQQFFNTLIQKQEELEEITNCVSLNDGEVRTVKKTSDSSSFQIKKINDKKNQITLNFVFSKNNQENLAKVTSCFAENQSKLRDKLGNELVFSFISDAKSSDITAEKITIMDTGRPNSLEWLNYNNMPCSTIIHETLHHLGLSDEYNESSSGQKIDQKNKTIESIAESTNFQTTLVKEKTILITYNFTFAKNNNEIIDRLNACFQEHEVKLQDKAGNEFNFSFISDEKSKESYSKKVELAPTALKISCNDLIDTTLQYLNFGKDLTIDYKGIRSYKNKNRPKIITTLDKDFIHLYDCRIKSPKNSIMSDQNLALKGDAIFYPAQMRMITNFGCTHKYRVYNLCAREAYKTSLAKYGDTLRCNPALPKECKHGSADWLK